MPDSIRVSATFPVTAKRLYEAWLDSKEHTDFTGGKADIVPAAGGVFTAWDGYIQGKTLELDPCRRILQAWRTSGFPPGSADSQLEVLFKEVEGGTEMTLVHTEIPEGQGQQYEEGWREFYFEPMTRYFQKARRSRKA